LKILFAGTPHFACPTLQALVDSPHAVAAVWTQPDRPAGRGQLLTASPVKTLAMTYGLPVHQPVSLKPASVQAQLADYHADVMVVAAYGLLLPQAVLTIPQYGCINVHASLLPRWRGASPIQQAILAGDSQTGITIMQMDPGLDTGEILDQAICAIDKNTTTAALQTTLAELGAKRLLAVLTAVEKGTLTHTRQEEAQASYAPKLTKAQARIDWRQSAVQIDRQIRAFNPWPVAYTDLGTLRIRIGSAEVVLRSAEMNTVLPGIILQVTTEGIDVATGQDPHTCLRIRHCQLPGKRMMSVQQILSGNTAYFKEGQQFEI
jgi:methionyl-tRNA formyltransferase